MKRYIITQVQIDKLMRDLWHSPQACVETLMTLKPIEPLSERQILKAIQSCGPELHGRIALTYESGPYDIDTPTVVATKLVSAIERRILGETT